MLQSEFEDAQFKNSFKDFLDKLEHLNAGAQVKINILVLILKRCIEGLKINLLQNKFDLKNEIEKIFQIFRLTEAILDKSNPGDGGGNFLLGQYKNYV